MKVAYLVNQYPHVSHSFIRREIAGLEVAGVEVLRFSVRPTSVDLPDPADAAERTRTAVLLAGGVFGLLLPTLATALLRPGRWLAGLAAAVRLGRRSGRGVLRHLVYLAEACTLARRLRVLGCDHVHAHFGTNPAAVALLTHLVGGVRYSFTVHGPEEFDRPEALSLGEKVAGAAFVVAISDFTRSQLFRWAAVEHWPRVHVVRCGVDAAFLDGGAGPVPDVPRLVCVGRLAEQKGQLLLLEALALVRDCGAPFEMVLAGDGPMRPSIEERLRVLDLSDRVRITGWLGNDAVRAEIRAARALVLPSFAEGLPVVLMEALALGRPVVATYIAGIPELVEDGVNGWLVPAGSAEALANAVVRVLAAPAEELTLLGRAGAERVGRRHDAAREAGRLAELFSAAAGQSASAAAAVLPAPAFVGEGRP
jgi:glycosyltransferase involved in cell wall biosynthesis